MDDFLEIIAVRRKQGLYTLMYYACWILIVIFAVVAAFSLTGVIGVEGQDDFLWPALRLRVVEQRREPAGAAGSAEADGYGGTCFLCILLGIAENTSTCTE